MPRLTLIDRLAAAVTGALFGGFVGFFLIFRSTSHCRFPENGIAHLPAHCHFVRNRARLLVGSMKVG
jgi:hypothetical protein